MIRYTISCDEAHIFEGWFSRSEDYDKQSAAGMISCPVCGSRSVSKTLMTPAVTTERAAVAPEPVAIDTAREEALARLKTVIATIRDNTEDVGERFPEEARKIHYGEADERGIMGKASVDEVRSLIDEGIEIAPLPRLPDDTN